MLSTRTDGVDDVVRLGCYVLVLLFNLFVGAWSVNYLLQVFLSKTLPVWGAALIGLFVAQLSVPVAIIVWVFGFLH